MQLLQTIFGDGFGYLGVHTGLGIWLVEFCQMLSMNLNLVALIGYTLACFIPVYMAYRSDRQPAAAWFAFSVYLTPPLALVVLALTKKKPR